MRKSALLLVVLGMLLIGIAPAGAATEPWTAEGTASLDGCLDADSADPATFSMTLTNPAEDWNDPAYEMRAEILFRNRSEPTDQERINATLAYGETGTWTHDVYASSLGPATAIEDQWRNWIVQANLYWYDGDTRVGQGYISWEDGYYYVPSCTVDSYDPYIVAWIDGASVFGGSDQAITGQDYVVGEDVSLYLNGVFVETVQAEPNAEGTGTPTFDVAFEPDDEIKLIGDSSERILIAPDLGISETSSTADTVSGWASPGSEVVVMEVASGTQQPVTAGTDGSWTADFAASYDIMTGDVVVALQYDEDGDIAGVLARVEGEPITPPKKVKFHETYKLPEDRPLVYDQGWLNVGCGGGEFEWPTEEGDYEVPGVLYEMDSGKMEAKWSAKYVGEDADGNWLYQMTQDFDWKKAVFESGTQWLHYESEDDWGYQWVGSGEYFDVESNAEMDALVRVVDPTQPVWPGNIEPIDGEIEMYFYIYDQTTGDLADWIVVEGTFEDGVPDLTMEGTCGG